MLLGAAGGRCGKFPVRLPGFCTAQRCDSDSDRDGTAQAVSRREQAVGDPTAEEAKGARRGDSRGGGEAQESVGFSIVGWQVGR